MVKNKKVNYTYGVGRRKEASARARVIKGKGETVVNDMSIAKYFPGEVSRLILLKPFSLTKTEDKYFATIRVVGGGKEAQLEASVLAISRALEKAKKDEFRTPLKKAGLLTRDHRSRERRKVNTGGKARRQKQSPKR
jgi:small subunit ribosomal protein S9